MKAYVIMLAVVVLGVIVGGYIKGKLGITT